MAESHFVSAMKQRRADYLGDLQRLQVEMATLEGRETDLISLLGSVDALLPVEAPEFDLDDVRPRKRRDPHPRAQAGSPDGEKRLPVTKAILRVLRTEKVPMTVEDVVDRLRTDYADIGERKLAQNIRTFLSSKKAAGILASNDERPLRYTVAA